MGRSGGSKSHAGHLVPWEAPEVRLNSASLRNRRTDGVSGANPLRTVKGQDVKASGAAGRSVDFVLNAKCQSSFHSSKYTLLHVYDNEGYLLGL